MPNDFPKSQGCTPSGSIFKNFNFTQHFPIYACMYSELSKTDFKQNSTCEWCATLIFWPIVYLHMTNHCPKSQGCTPSGSIFKKFYFTQYFPIYSELSKTDFKQNSIHLWMVYNPDFLAYSLSSHDQSLSTKTCRFVHHLEVFLKISIFNNTFLCIYSCRMIYKTDFKQNSTCEWCTTLILSGSYIVYLYMSNHCPKSQGCTPSGSILSCNQNDLKQNLSKTPPVNGEQPWICGL